MSIANTVRPGNWVLLQQASDVKTPRVPKRLHGVWVKVDSINTHGNLKVEDPSGTAPFKMFKHADVAAVSPYGPGNFGLSDVI